MRSSTSRSELERPEAAEVAALHRLAELAAEFGADRLTRETRSLAERVAAGQFYVACVGQFKRGKSTLLDALVGEAVLPTGVAPVTTVPTVLRYGGERRARVRSEQAGWSEVAARELEQFVAEEHNPQNRKRIAGVEVFVPSPLLAGGMCLVDTPGLGSVFASNTAATQAFIPHIDAAIVVVGADPPISGEELDIVEAVAVHVEHLLFVLNKADRVSEQERSAAVVFSRRVLQERLRRPVEAVFEVSALERLEGRGPERDWAAFTQALQQLALHSGEALTRAAAGRGIRRACQQMLAIAAEEQQALLRPREASEQHIQALHQTVAAAELALGDLESLLSAEQHKLSRLFEGRREAFLTNVRPAARQSLAADLAAIGVRSGPAFRREGLRAALEIARRQVMPWLEQEQLAAEEAYRKTALRFTELAAGFLRRIREDGLSEIGALPESLSLSESLRGRSRFYFHDFLRIARPASPLTYLADVRWGGVGAHGSIREAAYEFLELLLHTNASRVQNDLEERVRESRISLEGEVRGVLREVSAVAERAAAHARAAQDSGAEAVEAALARIRGAERELRDLQAREPA
jgi:hypothetical protein